MTILFPVPNHVCGVNPIGVTEKLRSMVASFLHHIIRFLSYNSELLIAEALTLVVQVYWKSI